MMFDDAPGGGTGHSVMPGHVTDHAAYRGPLQTAFRFTDA
jgi:hypothetical protein